MLVLTVGSFWVFGEISQLTVKHQSHLAFWGFPSFLFSLYISFWGSLSKLTSSWPPARVKWGWELRPLLHFGGILRWRRSHRWVPRGHFLCAGCVLESHLLGIGRPFWTPSHPKLPLGAQGAPNGPTESQGSQRKTKVTARRAPWEPKAPQRLSKRSPKSPQGEQNEFRRRSNEFNKSQNYIHINKIHANSRSTAIQRPTSIYSARSQHIQQKPKALIVSYPKRLFLQNGRHVSKTNKSCAGLVQWITQKRDAI